LSIEKCKRQKKIEKKQKNARLLQSPQKGQPQNFIRSTNKNWVHEKQRANLLKISFGRQHLQLRTTSVSNQF